MNPKNLVKLSNIVGTVSIILLIYWVFVFIAIQVFELRVFRENITETFYMSILGILALMAGALIINIMFNLTRIAEKHNQDATVSTGSTNKNLWLAFGLSFPLVLCLLFGGDYLTTRKKEKSLILSAESVVKDNPEMATKIANYSFDRKWLKSTGDIITVLSKTDKNFPHVSVIVKDSLKGSNVLLYFGEYYSSLYDTIPPVKSTYLLETTKEERDYLNRIFDQNFSDIRFSAHDGNYELYYPYSKNNRKIVLFFSDYQRYGKIGS